MRKETITVFVSDDGHKFETEEECVKYESEREQFFNAIETIKKHCCSRDVCIDCPLFDSLSLECCLSMTEPYSWDVEKLKKYGRKN